MLRPWSLATLVLCVACSHRVVSELPPMDGDGPIGEGRGSGASQGGGPQGPSQPGDGNGAGGSSSGAGSSGGPSGSSGGASGGGDAAGTGGRPPSGEPDAGAADAGASGGHADAGSDAGTTQLLALCVQQINEVRAQAGAAPLDEASDIEAYAAQAAASDARSGSRHGYYYATSGGNGVAATEDELDGAQIAPGADAQSTFEQGFQADVQARGGAYANLVDTQFTSAGCGFGQDASGNWWVVMALR
jgi:hypothetical protein